MEVAVASFRPSLQRYDSTSYYDPTFLDLRTPLSNLHTIQLLLLPAPLPCITHPNLPECPVSVEAPRHQPAAPPPGRPSRLRDPTSPRPSLRREARPRPLLPRLSSLMCRLKRALQARACSDRWHRQRRKCSSPSLKRRKSANTPRPQRTSSCGSS